MARRDWVSPVQHDRWSFLWLALGAVCTVFSGGRWQLPLAAWLSGVFILRFVRTQPLWRGLLIQWAVSTAIASVTWWDLVPVPPAAFFVTMAGGAAAYLLPLLADRLLGKRLPGFLSTLAYPAASTALDYLNVLASPMPSPNAQAYSLYGNLALLQLASVTGMWGLTFLTTWLSSVANWAWERRFAWRKVWRGAAVYGGLVLAVLVYGQVRLMLVPAAPGTIRAAAIVPVDLHAKIGEVMSAAREDRARFRQISAEHQDIYFADTVREAEAGAALVLWPEMAIPTAIEDEPDLIVRGKAVAAEHEIYLAMSYYTSYAEDRAGENKLVIIDPNGEITLEHLKFGGATIEGWAPGDGVLHTVETPFGALSGVICADTNFPLPMRQSGRNGTDVLLSPTLEWEGIHDLGTIMAVFRSIENGVNLFRAADNGYSIAVDAYGRVIGSTNHFQSDERVLVAQLPTSGVKTVYSVIGDVVPWLSIAGTLGLIVFAVVHRVRRGRDSDAEGKESSSAG
jgi:apolipoprotein N-acyltransferase